MASDADLAVQDELLDACACHYPIIDRVVRVVQMAVGIGNSLGRAAPRLTRHPTLSAIVHMYMGAPQIGSWEARRAGGLEGSSPFSKLRYGRYSKLAAFTTNASRGIPACRADLLCV